MKKKLKIIIYDENKIFLRTRERMCEWETISNYLPTKFFWNIDEITAKSDNGLIKL